MKNVISSKIASMHSKKSLTSDQIVTQLSWEDEGLDLTRHERIHGDQIVTHLLSKNEKLKERVSVPSSTVPFVKWAGGKRKLINVILSLAPCSFERYIEPFVGGGAVALSLAHTPMLLNDANTELIEVYCVVRDRLKQLLILLDGHQQHTEAYFYQIRAQNPTSLTVEEVELLLLPHPEPADFITQTFSGLYFTDAENQWLDNLVTNIFQISSPFKQSITFAALVRACLRRRPRGIFTYTGVRYDDGRRDLQISLEQHFRQAVELFNASVFDNGQVNVALNSDVFLLPQDMHFDLVYIDPPYVSPHSDNDYSRRYHFVEGLTRYWEGLEILEHTITKKFRRPPSPFDSKKSIYEAFHGMFERFREATIVVSYSSNGIPARDELYEMLTQYKSDVKVYECDHKYSFGTHNHKVKDNQNTVKEFLVVGR